MTRKGKAFLIGSVMPIIPLLAWAFVTRNGYRMDEGFHGLTVLAFPAILVGGLVGMIASVCAALQADGGSTSTFCRWAWMGRRGHGYLLGLELWDVQDSCRAG